MRRVWFLSSLVLGTALGIGCALDTEGQLTDASLGGSGGSGGTTTDAGADVDTPDISVPDGSCDWPKKVCVACGPGEPCPQPPAPGGDCVDFDDPAYGCAQDTCAPCDPGPNAEPRCLNSKCDVKGCSPGYESCDGDPETGCETNIWSLTNCGEGKDACGKPCAPARAQTASCNQGTCEITQCEAGWADCNNNPGDGCETNLRTIEDCGKCFELCTVEAPSNPTCAAGVCKPDFCPPGQADCDTNEQDCETYITTTSNCGSCGLVCSGPNVATWACNDVGGVRTCQVVTCDPGWGNCDGDHTNGCERDLRSSVDHCGACDAACSTHHTDARACNNGLCVPTCASGFGNCDGNKPGTTDNGCETNIRTLSDCGGCGVTCSRANATATCGEGICSIATCNAGYGNCDGLDPNGCETNTNSLVPHCGACNAACSTINTLSRECKTGLCVPSCASGFGNCDGNKPGTTDNGCETNIRTLTNCGDCGVACSRANATATCATGTCSIASCNPEYDNCDGEDPNGCEINITSSPSNCGACDTVCTLDNAIPDCVNSACTIASCNADYRDCDGTVSNGCEINITNNPDHCGGCGTVCALANANSGCADSACTIVSCNADYRNCDGTVSNGCEVDITSNSDHCGGCDQECALDNATSGCANSACTIASCIDPYEHCDTDVDNGCETDTSTNTSHCGGCNQTCKADFTCEGGVCKCTDAPCAPGECNGEGKCVCGGNTCNYNESCNGSNCTP